MKITLETSEELLSSMSDLEQSQLLAIFGHELTILGRNAYEFQGPGVTSPRLLRDINEIQHRVFGQLISLTRNRQPTFSPDILASWLLGEGKPHLQPSLTQTFERAITRHRDIV